MDKHAASSWMFRGVGSVDHDLIPKVGRNRKRYSPEKEKALLASFKRDARRHLVATPDSDWEWLAIAQHHGLPTRLLDWTSNALVACYFAVTADVDPGHDATGRIYATHVNAARRADFASAGDPFAMTRVARAYPQSFTDRVVSQRGFFTAHPDPVAAWKPAGKSVNTFDIDPTLKQVFRRRLYRLGIDAWHIGGDIDGLCENLQWQYRSGLVIL